MAFLVVMLICSLAAINGKPTAETTTTTTPKQPHHFDNVFDEIIAVNSNFQYKGNNGDSRKQSSESGIRLFEADIIVTDRLISHLAKDGNTKVDNKDVQRDASSHYRWETGVIAYEFDPNFDSNYVAVVLEAIEEFHAKSCLTFVRRTTERDYLYFKHDGGCWSSIGKLGGEQDISLGHGCGTKGIAIHEIMHAIGFFHEQSRRDRDNHVQINWDNIIDGMEHNFQMHDNGEASDLNEPYDMDSVMHYGNYAFAKTYDEMTIFSIHRPSEPLGQREGLSAIDVRQLNKYYRCNGNTKRTTTTTTTTTTTQEPATTKKTTRKTTTSTTPQPTTVKKTTEAPKKACYDTMACCPILKTKGLCANTWVNDNCMKSCGSCPVTTTTTTTTTTTDAPSQCKDDHEECVGWSKRSEFCDAEDGCCHNVEYGYYMELHCAQSCGFC